MNKVSKLRKHLEHIGISNQRLIKLATDLEGRFATGINYRAVSQALGFGANPSKEQHPLVMDAMNNDQHIIFTKEQVDKIRSYDFSIYSMNNFNVKNSLSKEERAFLAIVDVLDILNPKSMIRDYIVASDLKFNQLFKRMRDAGWIENDWLNPNFYKTGVDALNKLQEEYHNADNEFKDQGRKDDRFIDLSNVVFEYDGYQMIYLKSTEENAPLYNNKPETSNDRTVLGNKLHLCLGSKSGLYQNNNNGKIYGIFKTGTEEPIAAIRINGSSVEEARCKYNKDLPIELYPILINYIYGKNITIGLGSGFELSIDKIYELTDDVKEKAIEIIKNDLDDDQKKALDKMLEIGIDQCKDREIVIKNDKGNIIYYKNLKLHREDGPAIERADGTKEWFINGIYHRIDGPAYEGANGSKHWYIKGELHRIDGPAVEYANGTKEWYIMGKQYTEDEFNKIIFNYNSEKDKPTEIDLYGNKYWKNDKGQLHREDGPAIKFVDGTREWYLNGLRHRKNGPAIEKDNGRKEWYINGKLHREDGPAIECFNGDKAWYINNKLHREDGPAIEWSSGKFWYIKGERHRLDGPAIEFADGYKEWWIDGEIYSKMNFPQAVQKYLKTNKR